MKNYFDFKLTGGKLFMVYIAMFLSTLAFLAVYFTVVIPFGAINNPSAMADISPGSMIAKAMISLVLFLIIYYAIYLVFVKLYVEHIEYKGELIKTDYNMGTYLGMILVNTLLTIFTLGVYGAWFEKKMFSFFIDNASHGGDNFRFNGSGLTLFGLIFLCIFLPIIVISIMIGIAAGASGEPNPAIMFIFIILYIFIIGVFSFLYYKWMINISFRNRTFVLQGDTMKGAMFIIGQILLTIITFMIYFPAAMIRMYRYFAERTVSVESGNITARIGTDVSVGKDYLFILGQYLLCGITLGIYGPWAITNIDRRFLSQTYVEVYEPAATSEPEATKIEDHNAYMPTERVAD